MKYMEKDDFSEEILELLYEHGRMDGRSLWNMVGTRSGGIHSDYMEMIETEFSENGLAMMELSDKGREYVEARRETSLMELDYMILGELNIRGSVPRNQLLVKDDYELGVIERRIDALEEEDYLQWTFNGGPTATLHLTEKGREVANG